jgi:hypothetical protein
LVLNTSTALSSKITATKLPPLLRSPLFLIIDALIREKAAENPSEHEFAYSYEACKGGLCNVTENVPLFSAIVREEF